MNSFFAFITGNLFAVVVIFVVAYMVGVKYPGIGQRVGL